MGRASSWIFLSITLSGLSAFAQQPVPTSPSKAPQLTAPGPQRQQPPSGHAQGSNQKAPITNADVIKMVKGGVPGSAIVASIRSGSGAFDLSNEARAALFGVGGKDRASEMTKIWDAMIAKATNGRGGDDTDEPNPQPSPPKGKANTPEQLGSQTVGVRSPGLTPNSHLAIKLGAPRTGPQVKNPHAAEGTAAIIVVLQKQKQVADSESAQIKLGIHPQSQTSLPAVHSQPVSVNSGTKGSATGAPAITMPRAPSAGVVGPEKTSDATENSLATRAATMTLLDTSAIVCAHDPTFRILNVSGSSFPATFTPIDQFNLYTITGCSFGNPGPNAKVYIYGKGSFQGNFVVKFWSDNSVVLSLDPSISGYPDLDNLTLVIQREDRQQFQKGGFKFYAARGDGQGNAVPLKQIPATRAKLLQGPGMDLQYSSPVSNLPDVAAVISRNFRIEMDRPTSNATINGQNGVHVNGGLVESYPYEKYKVEDGIDTSHLAQGFASVSAAIEYWTPARDAGSMCGAGDDIRKRYSDDPGAASASPPWKMWWEGDVVRVEGPLYYCYDLEVWKENEVAQSQYALQVWVMGPRCLDPWTGQPDTACIAEVKKQLGQ